MCYGEKKNLITESVGLSYFLFKDDLSIKVIFDPRCSVERNCTVQDTGKTILGRGKTQM